jgi:uncharacterized protein YunC (DUF1805 family)
MSDALPQTTSYPMRFKNGCAVGLSIRWREGQYCTILTEAGMVGCGMYDVEIAAEFHKPLAIARSTPEHPLSTPEDLLDARITELTPQAKALGIDVGMTGREAVELLLAVSANRGAVPRSPMPSRESIPDAAQDGPGRGSP